MGAEDVFLRIQNLYNEKCNPKSSVDFYIFSNFVYPLQNIWEKKTTACGLKEVIVMKGILSVEVFLLGELKKTIPDLC